MRRIVLTLSIITILLGCTAVNVNIVYSEDSGGRIDIFTQKQPYGGMGLNVSSDAFGPGETVVINALVTYNDYPEALSNVAFEVHGPPNPSYNITIFEYGRTNTSGVASVSFRIGSVDETNFGEWVVIGSVNVADIVFRDFLFFRVGWIVEVLSAKTIDGNGGDQIGFMRGDDFGVELAVRNIAWTEKKATLAITAYDLLNRTIGSAQIDDYTVPPNETVVYVRRYLPIPDWASAGNATVFGCAFTAPISLGGVPYCPKTRGLFSILFSDVTILNATASPTVVYQGEKVEVSVTVKNTGQGTESFSVSVFRNVTHLIDAEYVSDLLPNSIMTLTFVWNTSSVSSGFYKISASAEPVPGEINIADNHFADGVVEVRLKLPSFHDISILDIEPTANTVYTGNFLDIKVKVKNEGGWPESFDVTVYYNLSIAGVLFVDGLTADTEATLVLHWDTQGIAVGDYILSAYAGPVTEEEDIRDNSFTDGVVKVALSPAAWFVPYWFYWLLLLFLVFAVVLLVLWLYRRRKRSAEKAFYSGWTAWYYCYDPRGKMSKYPLKQRGRGLGKTHS
jgi:hypothetical protein